MLGALVKEDLLSVKAVKENICKARHAFFHYGSMGAFQWDLRVMPVLLNGYENWVFDKGGAFQRELVKQFSNTVWDVHFQAHDYDQVK